jgi:hypothetical protein
MTKLLCSSLALGLVLFAFGCSEDDPTDPGNTPEETATTTWDETGGFWRSVVDASDYDNFIGFSFADKDTVGSLQAVGKQPSSWDIAFRREVIKLNGGSSGDGGFAGADLGGVDYASVGATAADGAQWMADAVDYMIDNWFTYDFNTHQLDLTRNVYSILDATGEHFVKFRVDSLSGELSPESMGNVHLTYFYQANANDRSLNGVLSTAMIEVGTGAGYFDFSSGTAVTPADPSTSLEWDIRFQNFELAQNSGPSGSGECAAFYAFTEIADPTDIEAFVQQPAGAPLFPDIPGSVMTDWYDYNGQTHQLSSKNRIYLLQSGERLYKVKILTYYGNRGGVPVSGVYTLHWNEL